MAFTKILTTNLDNNVIATLSAVATVNTRITIAEGVDVGQNTRMSIIEGVDTTQNTNITIATNAATAAFEQANATAGGLTTANSRITIAEGVDVGQNTRMDIIEGVDTTQNTRITISEGVDVGQNTRMAIIEGVDTTQNTNITIATNAATAAFEQANATAGGLTSANTRLTIAEGVDVGQNTRMTIIEGVDTTQNTNITNADSKAQAAFDKANAANSLAQAAYNQANTGGDQFARDTANSASSNTIIIQGVDTTQNTNITNADSKAQAAFDKANTSITTSGGTITGSLNVSQELTVTGNLNVLGTTTTINTSSFTVSDALIQLATGNYTSDLLDIGISGHYNDGTNAHTGLIRDHGTKDWYLFKGYTPELSGNNNIDINHASFAKANVHADYVKANVIASTVSGNVIALNTSALSNTMIGYLGVPQRVVVMGGSDSLVLADAGKQLYLRPDSNVYSIFIPSNASVPFPVGTAIVTILTGPYSANVAPLAGVTLRMAGNTSGANIARTLESYSMASLLKVENDVWYISGAGVT
jgi:flagellar biogenesis protein FliO